MTFGWGVLVHFGRWLVVEEGIGQGHLCQRNLGHVGDVSSPAKGSQLLENASLLYNWGNLGRPGWDGTPGSLIGFGCDECEVAVFTVSDVEARGLWPALVHLSHLLRSCIATDLIEIPTGHGVSRWRV